MEEKSFEQSMERLEAIVKKLESGSGTLDEMISLYEEGMKLHADCSGRLDEYEAKLSKLSANKEE